MNVRELIEIGDNRETGGPVGSTQTEGRKNLWLMIPLCPLSAGGRLRTITATPLLGPVFG